MAMAATDVGLNGAMRAGPNVPIVLRRANHLDTKLVSQNPRISEKRLTAREGVEIGSADAYTMNPYKSFSWGGRRRGGGLLLEVARLIEHNLTHLVRWYHDTEMLH
jgi:hypothetical protein